MWFGACALPLPDGAHDVCVLLDAEARLSHALVRVPIPKHVNQQQLGFEVRLLKQTLHDLVVVVAAGGVTVQERDALGIRARAAAAERAYARAGRRWRGSTVLRAESQHQRGISRRVYWTARQVRRHGRGQRRANASLTVSEAAPLLTDSVCLWVTGSMRWQLTFSVRPAQEHGTGHVRHLSCVLQLTRLLSCVPAHLACASAWSAPTFSVKEGAEELTSARTTQRAMVRTPSACHSVSRHALRSWLPEHLPAALCPPSAGLGSARGLECGARPGQCAA